MTSGISGCVGVVGQKATGARGTFRSQPSKTAFQERLATATQYSLLLELFFLLKKEKKNYKFLVLFFQALKKSLKKTTSTVPKQIICEFQPQIFFDKSCNTLVGIKCILIVKNTHNCAMLKKINSKENIVEISEKETFSSFGLTNFSILFSVLREVEPFGTTLNSMKNQPGSQTTKKVRYF